MITQTLWIDRTFNFDFPVGLYPCLVERLRGTPARLEELVRDLDETTLNHKPGDTFSIREQVEHLVIVETLHVFRLDQYENGVTVLQAADRSTFTPPLPDFSPITISDVLARFRSDRARFVARLESVDEQLVGRTAHHPRLNQPMRLVDMLLFAAEHDDHHLAHISSLKRG